MAKISVWLDTRTAGKELGHCSSSVWRICKRNPGFALQFGNHFRIPRQHIDRVLLGETVQSVAASPSWLDDSEQRAA